MKICRLPVIPTFGESIVAKAPSQLGNVSHPACIPPDIAMKVTTLNAQVLILNLQSAREKSLLSSGAARRMELEFISAGRECKQLDHTQVDTETTVAGGRAGRAEL